MGKCTIAFGLGAILLFYELAKVAAMAWVMPKGQLTTAVAQNELIDDSAAPPRRFEKVNLGGVGTVTCGLTK